MTLYYLSLSSSVPLKEGMNEKVSQFSSLISARAYARSVMNTHPSYRRLWIEAVTKDGVFTRGCVLFDRSKAGYRGLGWVYFSPDMDHVMKLGKDGSISKFTDRRDLYHAKVLSDDIWATRP